ncbi:MULTISPECIES: hypothetical protein [unclassified Methanoregula]|uniref:hypothetical protein n=1 Tax=unclassified Methanoregula TaxID=2649730 RepID=UPI0025D635EE|nr:MULTISPECIES: hypothetical protein [unclassified Methanoregula]
MTPTHATASNPYSPAVRLLAIPLLVYLAWLLETFLLAGMPRLLEEPDPVAFAVYTGISCIFTGMILPLLCIRKAFLSGAVNMFQIGFSSSRRTLILCSLIGIAGYALVLLFSPFGPDRLAFAGACLLLLPTAAASVMVCWALFGTHIQAFFREGGAVLSIPTGIVTTSILFAAAIVAVNPAIRMEGSLFWPVCIGMGAALFFFAVRDVCATVMVVTGLLILSGTVIPDSFSWQAISPAVWLSSLLAGAALGAIPVYLHRNYTTIVVRTQD